MSVFICEVNDEIVEAHDRGENHEDFDDSVIARYDLKREDIEALDWVITYPPSEEMKGIHMWPEYQSYLNE